MREMPRHGARWTTHNMVENIADVLQGFKHEQGAATPVTLNACCRRIGIFLHLPDWEKLRRRAMLLPVGD